MGRRVTARKGAWSQEEINTFALIAHFIDLKIGELDRLTSDLMKEHATVKAAGPAHTSRFLEEFVQELLGPHWRELAYGFREAQRSLVAS